MVPQQCGDGVEGLKVHIRHGLASGLGGRRDAVQSADIRADRDRVFAGGIEVHAAVVLVTLRVARNRDLRILDIGDSVKPATGRGIEVVDVSPDPSGEAPEVQTVTGHLTQGRRETDVAGRCKHLNDARLEALVPENLRRHAPGTLSNHRLHELGSEHVFVGDVTLVVTQSLVGEEEKQLVLLDRPADTSSELPGGVRYADRRIVTSAVHAIEFVEGVQSRVVILEEPAAVELVGTGLRDYLHGGAGVAAVLGLVAVGDDLDLLHRFLVRADHRRAAPAKAVGAHAVQRKVVI